MAVIIPIAQTQRRAVSEKHVQVATVDQSVEQEPGYQAETFHLHLEVGELILAVIVADAAPQSCDYQSLYPLNPIADIGAAEKIRRMVIIVHPVPHKVLIPAKQFEVFEIVIAEYEQDRTVQRAGHKTQVAHVQVAGAQHQIHIPKAFPGVEGIHQGIDVIGNTKDSKLGGGSEGSHQICAP
jgi:hypothetical protein